MVVNISAVFPEYEERVQRLQKVPRFSHGRRMVRLDGAPNRAWTPFIAIKFRFRLRAYFHCHVPLIIRSPVIIFRLEF